MANKKLDDKKNEMKQYQKGVYYKKIPFWFIATLIKYWYFGACCFFLAFGAGLKGYWFALAAGLGGGAFYDIAVRHFLLALETNKHETKYHIMCASKKYYSFPLNVLYNIVLFYVGVTLITLIHLAGLDYFGNEPFSMGLVLLVVDVLFLMIKFSIMTITNHIKNKNGEVIDKNNIKE